MTTGRRDDDTTFYEARLTARFHKESQRSQRPLRWVEISAAPSLPATSACRPTLAGVREGQPQAGIHCSAGLWLALPHSCHRAKRGAVSGCNPSKRLTRSSLCAFVCFVFLVMSAAARPVAGPWPTSCRRTVVSSSRPKARRRRRKEVAVVRKERNRAEPARWPALRVECA
jgi:hypothetical protein